MSKTRVIYSEPEDYFPKEIREKFFPELCVDSERFNEISRTILSHMLESSDKNIVFSPYSIYVILDILVNSTSGKTKNEVTSFLSDGTYSSDTLSVIDQHLEGSDQFSSTNAAMVKSDLNKYIDKLYIQMLKDHYDAEYFSTKDLIKEVNDWVCKKTKGKITQIADDTMKDMVFALINAVSFNAEWLEEYDGFRIYEDEFTNYDNTKSDVIIMHSNEDYYIEDDTFTGFIKKYKGEEFSFLGLLPKDNKVSLKNTVNNLNITNLYSKAKEAIVLVAIPEYRTEYGIELSDLFKSEGIKEAFTDNADFSPVCTEIPPKIQKIIHKACIEVDKQGTKVEAITFESVECGSAPDSDEIKEVELNRPFIYSIVHNKTHLPLFFGVVNKL